MEEAEREGFIGEEIIDGEGRKLFAVVGSKASLN